MGLFYIWCFGHCLDLPWKTSWKASFIDPEDESLLHMFYLYKNSSKNVRELENLYQILKEQFETYGKNTGPVKSTRLEQDGLIITFGQWKSLLAS